MRPKRSKKTVRFQARSVDCIDESEGEMVEVFFDSSPGRPPMWLPPSGPVRTGALVLLLAIHLACERKREQRCACRLTAAVCSRSPSRPHEGLAKLTEVLAGHRRPRQEGPATLGASRDSRRARLPGFVSCLPCPR